MTSNATAPLWRRDPYADISFRHRAERASLLERLWDVKQTRNLGFYVMDRFCMGRGLLTAYREPKNPPPGLRLQSTPWLDHYRIFRRGRKPAVLLSEPYGVADVEKLQAFVTWAGCEAIYTTSRCGGWIYLPGRTAAVVCWWPDVISHEEIQRGLDPYTEWGHVYPISWEGAA